MIAKMNLDRRALLGILAACAAPMGPPAQASSPSGTDSGPLRAIYAGAMMTDRESASLIGLQYLKAFPTERDSLWTDSRIAELVATLERGVDDPIRLNEVLAAFQQADFEAGDVVCVAGWVLSRLEARLCALFVLAEI